MPALLAFLGPDGTGALQDPAVVRWAVEVLGLVVAHDAEARELVIEAGGVEKLDALTAAGSVGRDVVRREAARTLSLLTDPGRLAEAGHSHGHAGALLPTPLRGRHVGHMNRVPSSM